jgi:3-oxoacyl-[acyl-carrier protein] reductase
VNHRQRERFGEIDVLVNNAGTASRIPVGRLGGGAEIAQAVVLLVSNGLITGQTIAVNGGALFS